MITEMYNSRVQWEGSVKAACILQPTATETLLSEDHLQILNAKKPCFWMAIFTVYLHCCSRLFPSKHHMITVWKGLLPEKNSQLVHCFFLCYSEALTSFLWTSQCLQTSNPISLSEAIQKYFQMLDPCFPFYRQEMALAITQKVPVFTAGPGSFLPCTRCKETQISIWLSLPAEHCPHVLQTSLSHLVHSVFDSVFVNTLIPILQFRGFPRQHQGSGCSWVAMLRMPNPRTAAATSATPTTSNGEKSSTVLQIGSGWMPMGTETAGSMSPATSVNALTPHWQVKQFAEKT